MPIKLDREWGKYFTINFGRISVGWLQKRQWDIQDRHTWGGYKKEWRLASLALLFWSSKAVNKVKRWSIKLNEVVDMMNTSGFDWDDVRKCIIVDSEQVLMEYLHDEHKWVWWGWYKKVHHSWQWASIDGISTCN